MILLFMVYGSFSLLTNLLFEFKTENCKGLESLLYGLCFYNENSTFSQKNKNEFYMSIQLWLGALMCLIMMVGLKLITTLGMKKDKEIDDSLDSASDYTIKIQNLPFGEYDEGELIEYLKELWIDYPSELELKSIQIIYNMEEEEKAIQELLQLAEVLMSCLQKNDYRMSDIITHDRVEEYKEVKR